MKAIGEKVLGWFIVQEDEETPRGEEAVSEVRAAAVAPPPTARSGVPVLSLPAEAMPASFVEVYRSAGIPEVEYERLGKTLDLVASLPAEATASVKRTIVEAALNAFGIPLDRIAESATAALGALDRHVTSGEGRTEAARTATEEQIRKLTSEIERLRRAVATQEATQRALVQATARERARLTSVLEFFGR